MENISINLYRIDFYCNKKLQKNRQEFLHHFNIIKILYQQKRIKEIIAKKIVKRSKIVGYRADKVQQNGK